MIKVKWIIFSIILALKIFFYFHILILKKQILDIKKEKYVKICICTCCKDENRYIIEFANHYFSYGTDKIYIYDNNDIDGERFENVINGYLKNNSIEIVNYRGKSKIQMDAFNDCYQKLKTKYDWIIFYDIDEFIHLKNFQNIKKYLNQYHFIKCNAIYLNHVIHTDNNQIYYHNSSLTKRFPKTYKYNKFEKNSEILLSKGIIKTILRGNLSNIIITNPHFLSKKISNTCNGDGKIINVKSIRLRNPDYNRYYYDHYIFKSCEEYLHKLSKGSVFFGKRRQINLGWLNKYFSFNKITKQKIDYLKKNTYLKINMNSFKIKSYRNK